MGIEGSQTNVTTTYIYYVYIKGVVYLEGVVHHKYVMHNEDSIHIPYRVTHH